MSDSSPENGYRKPNKCPYCNHFCDAALCTDDDMEKPSPGDISFCIICFEPAEFDKDMKLIKFDLDSIQDAYERNRLKDMRSSMKHFIKNHPEYNSKGNESYEIQ